MNMTFHVHIHIREYEYESNMAENIMFIFANMNIRASLLLKQTWQPRALAIAAEAGSHWTEAPTLAHPRDGKETSDDGSDIIDVLPSHCLYSAAATSASSIISKGGRR
jgi:hypothetical protein